MALGVTAVILGATTTALWQVFTVNNRSVNHMSAVRQVQSAGYWVSRDALMAKTISISGTASHLPMTLSWIDWDGTAHSVTYSIDINNRLERSEGASQSFVASYIISGDTDPNGTNCEFVPATATTPAKLTFTVKATVGSGSTAGTETRVYEVMPRTSR
jgi:hypothetical protein